MKGFAKKSLGQNFLVDQQYISRIVLALDLSPHDTIIEIGPGRGALTVKLVDAAGKVIALELDRNLVPFLREEFAGRGNFSIIEGDALTTEFSSLLSQDPGSVKLIANLPYYISTAILQRLTEQRDTFSSMILMFQKEVVDRVTAKPGNSERGFLTVFTEAFLDAEKLFDVPPTAFRPQPKVWSSVVRIFPKRSLVKDESTFRDLVSYAFLQKRKTILNNLKGRYPNAASILEQAEIDPKLRPEALTLGQWLRLADVKKEP